MYYNRKKMYLNLFLNFNSYRFFSKLQVDFEVKLKNVQVAYAILIFPFLSLNYIRVNMIR